MKAKDLMICDWVMGKKNQSYFQIKRISTKWVMDKDGCYSNFVDIKPIPLIPEILEKNGFMLQDSWYCRVIGDDKICVNLPKEGSIYQYTDIEYQKLVYNPEDVTEVEYGASMTFKGTISVHQPQHAFRLCGIDKEIEL